MTCDNISVLSGEYDTLILKSSCDKPIKCISIHCYSTVWHADMYSVYPKIFLSLLDTCDYCDTTFYTTGVHDMYVTVCNGDCCTLKLVRTVCCCAMTTQFFTPVN